VANGRVICRAITVSDKANSLTEDQSTRVRGEQALCLYCISYAFSDDWGHLPYDSKWLGRMCFPGSSKPKAEIEEEMNLLAKSGLWDTPYSISGKTFTHIHRFEDTQRDGIRKRRRGEWPDESGSIPRRNQDHNIDESIACAAKVRESSKHHEPAEEKKQLPVKPLGIKGKDLVLGEINNQQITMAFWNFMVENSGGITDDAARLLYRAKVKSDKNICGWITAGFLDGYIFNTCDDEENNTRRVKGWMERWLNRVAELEVTK